MLATLVVAMMAVAGPAVANPPNPQDTGCPNGHPMMSVETMAEAGCGLPGLIDGAGNDDGYVWARALGDGWFQIIPNAPVDTIFSFTDNTWFSS